MKRPAENEEIRIVDIKLSRSTRVRIPALTGRSYPQRVCQRLDQNQFE